MNMTEVRMDLLAAIERLGRILPANTLDQLINQLGGPNYVAEVSLLLNKKGNLDFLKFLLINILDDWKAWTCNNKRINWKNSIRITQCRF